MNYEPVLDTIKKEIFGSVNFSLTLFEDINKQICEMENKLSEIEKQHNIVYVPNPRISYISSNIKRQSLFKKIFCIG